jgi:hypothetical protein
MKFKVGGLFAISAILARQQTLVSKRIVNSIFLRAVCWGTELIDALMEIFLIYWIKEAEAAFTKLGLIATLGPLYK